MLAKPQGEESFGAWREVARKIWTVFEQTAQAGVGSYTSWEAQIMRKSRTSAGPRAIGVLAALATACSGQPSETVPLPEPTLVEGRGPTHRSGSPCRCTGTFEVMKGLAFNRWHEQDRRLYALDALRLQLLRVDVTTGAREVLAADPKLFNLPVASAFLPSSPGVQTLVVASDQEHRFAGINQAISADMFQLPFLVTEVLIRD